MTSVTGSVIVVFGTAPEIIKLAPVVHTLGDRALLVHTASTSTRNMSDTFLEQLHLGQPDHQLEVGGLTRGPSSAVGSRRSSRCSWRSVLRRCWCRATPTPVWPAPFAANAAGIPRAPGGRPAQLRPADAGGAQPCADEHARRPLPRPDRGQHRPALRHEGVADGTHPSGRQHTPRSARTRCSARRPDGWPESRRWGCSPAQILATIHRAENADDRVRLRSILAELAASPLPVLLPLHPRRHAPCGRAFRPRRRARSGAGRRATRLRGVRPARRGVRPDRERFGGCAGRGDDREAPGGHRASVDGTPGAPRHLRPSRRGGSGDRSCGRIAHRRASRRSTGVSSTCPIRTGRTWRTCVRPRSSGWPQA